MPALKDLSTEQLLDRLEELQQAKDEEIPWTYSHLIEVTETFITRIKRDRHSEYAHSLPYLTKKHVSNLIYYGTYLKTEYLKDDQAAERTLKQAVRHDPKNPIVHYRLGFLAYKRKAYSEAITYLERAIAYQQPTDMKGPYHLQDQQLTYAHLYLCNAAMLIAERTQNAMKDRLNGTVEALASYPLSTLHQMIQHNNQQLVQGEYVIQTQEGIRYVSQEEAYEVKNNQPLHTLVLISDRQPSLGFNGKEIELRSVDQLEMLRYLLLFSTKSNPKTLHDFADLFASSNKSETARSNTFRQRIARLREKLSLLPDLPDIIETAHQSYYFNQSIPFMIIHPVVDTFLLGGEEESA